MVATGEATPNKLVTCCESKLAQQLRLKIFEKDFKSKWKCVKDRRNLQYSEGDAGGFPRKSCKQKRGPQIVFICDDIVEVWINREQTTETSLFGRSAAATFEVA